MTAIRKRKRRRSKLGMLLDDKGYTLKEFASLVYYKTGYLIHIQNLSTYCSGQRKIVRIDTAQKFAETLGVDLKDIL